MSRMVNRAELELDMFLEQEETVDKSIKPKILEMLEVFSNQGHSGMSAGLVINLFKTVSMEQLVESGAFDEEQDFYGGMTGESVKELVDKFTSQDYGNVIQRKLAQDIFITLAKQDPILPIMNVDMEWGEPSTFGDDDTFQNKRLSSVFKKGKDGRPYYLDAIVWRDENGSCWSGSKVGKDGSKITSSQYIKVPFEPRTFYVDVVKEILPEDWTEEPFYEDKYYETEEYEETGVKRWIVEKYREVVKDEKQLEEVFEYYDRKN